MKEALYENFCDSLYYGYFWNSYNQFEWFKNAIKILGLTEVRSIYEDALNKLEAI